MKRIALVAVVAALVASCVAVDDCLWEQWFAEEGRDYSLTWSVNRENRAFDVVLTPLRGPMCVHIGTWPADGYGYVGEAVSSLHLDGRTIPSRAEDVSGHCVGDCYDVVRLGDQLRGAISFENFPDPTGRYAYDNAQLEFTPGVLRCRTQDLIEAE